MTAQTPKHTPGDWILSGNTAYSESCKDRGHLFECNLSTGTHIPDDQNEANAEYIVRCVNSHDALLEACKQAERDFNQIAYEPFHPLDMDHRQMVEAMAKCAADALFAVRAAIAKNQGGAE